MEKVANPGDHFSMTNMLSKLQEADDRISKEESDIQNTIDSLAHKEEEQKKLDMLEQAKPDLKPISEIKLPEAPKAPTELEKILGAPTPATPELSPSGHATPEFIASAHVTSGLSDASHATPALVPSLSDSVKQQFTKYDHASPDFTTHTGSGYATAIADAVLSKPNILPGDGLVAPLMSMI